jgi:hypothetical protein
VTRDDNTTTATTPTYIRKSICLGFVRVFLSTSSTQPKMTVQQRAHDVTQRDAVKRTVPRVTARQRATH